MSFRVGQAGGSDDVAGDQLRAFIERLERMHEERKAIADDIREIYAEAKGNGFSVPALKTVLKIRAADPAERLEHEAIVDLYLSQLGMSNAPRDDEDEEPRAPAPASAREIIEEFAAEGGERNPQSLSNRDVSAGEKASSGAGPQAEALHSQGTGAEALAVPDGHFSGGGESVHTAEAVASTPPQSALPPKSFVLALRPHCQHPDKCASAGGKVHCFECRKASFLATGEHAA